MTRLRWLLFAAVVVAAGGHPGAQNVVTPRVAPFVTVREPVVALEHVRIIDGTGAPPVEDQTIILTDGRIARVGPAARLAVPRGARRLNLAGRTVIPGLVGLHEHLFYPAGDNTSFASQPFAFPRLYLAGGVTTARTAGTFDLQTDQAVKREIDDGRAPGPALLLTAPYMDGATLASSGMTVVKTPEQARVFVDYWADRGVHSFKAYTHIPRDALAAAVSAAHARGLMVTGHLCSVTFSEAAAMGIDNVEHGFLVASDWAATKEPDECPADQSAAFERLDVSDAPAHGLIGRLVARGVAITSTLAVTELPELQARFREALAPATLRAFIARRTGTFGPGRVTFPDSQKEVVLERAFVRAGGLLVAGADPTGDGQVLPGFGDQRNIELLVEGGFTPVEAIRVATLNGAILLGLDRQIGSIEVGKQADLVVIDGNPAARIDDIERVVTVFKEGIGYDSARLLASVRGRVGLTGSEP